MDLSKWKSQLRKGFIEFSLLKLLSRRERLYGLEMLESLSDAGIELSEGTLYPLLNRLVREKYLLTSWETKNLSGHPRKYYRLSAKASDALARMETEWNGLVQTVENL